MTSPDLLYTDVEDDLRASVRGLLADRCPPSAVLARCESGAPQDLGLWRTLAGELGLAGLLVPERLGGPGASARETAVVLEELGAAVAPVPFFGSAVLATSALLGCDTYAEPVESLLARLGSAEATAALAVPLPLAPGSPFPDAVRASHSNGGIAKLSGWVTSVADAPSADVLIVPALSPDGPGLYEVRSDDPGVSAAAAVPLDLTRPLADLTFEGATARRLAGPATAAPALDGALLAGAGLLASEQVGIAQWCLDETVAYLSERTQFGRTVGSFQSLKHRLAEVWQDVVGARAAARNAADALATGSPDTPVAVAVAQAYCAPAAVRAAEECVQLHGGIGMTWEHPAHLYLKRAKADEIALGSPGRHRASIAGLVDLPPASPS